MDVFFRNGKNAVLRKVNIMKREGQVRIPSGCAISAVISREGRRMTGEKIVESMIPMHDRSNGLGGGFAGYGIYPEYRDFYAFHIFFDTRDTRKTCEALLKEGFEIVRAEHIPIRQIPEVTDVPLIWRYFLAPMKSVLNRLQLDEEEYVARIVTKINAELEGAYVFSSGKNMGAFKAVGYPEDVGRFYRLDEYEAYSWTAHGRYPTNTPGWWGGAHPFSLLEWSVVHNGEISSYDANRRCVEMFGYQCTLQTDTEVMAYIADYLLRRQGLTLEEAASGVMTVESVMLMATAALSRSEISFLPCFTCFMVLYVPFIPCYTFRCLRMLVAVPRPQSTKPSSTKPPTM
mgnify:CR=1 FL=1